MYAVTTLFRPSPFQGGIGIYDVKGNTMSDAMQNGTVKFFNTTKGFGFIQPDAYS